jgi:hypothetical protein
VSVWDYYCYKFQIRPGIFNPILYEKRLFQHVTSQDFIKFWGKFFAFVLLVLIENSQGCKTFELFKSSILKTTLNFLLFLEKFP